MAWGYEKSFTIEHDTTVKRKIDCKDCVYYDSSDKSCMKRPLYLPEDGYDSWKRCQYFELSNSVSHYDEKRKQYSEFLIQKKKAAQLASGAVKKSEKKTENSAKKGTKNTIKSAPSKISDKSSKKNPENKTAINHVEIKNKKYRSFTDEILLCNFITLWNEKGEAPQCLCGGQLDYSDQIHIRYHKKGTMTQITISGKRCRDCHRKFVVKKDLMEEVAKH